MNRIPKTVDSQFLIRVIQSNVTPEEMEFFENWLGESDKNKEEFSTLSLLWDKMDSSRMPAGPDPEIMWRRIVSTLSSPINPSLSLSSIRSSSKNRNVSFGQKHSGRDISGYIWLRIAFLIILVAGIHYIFNNYQTSEQSLPNAEPLPDAIVIKQYTLSTEKGERVTLPLGDGSIVYLNSESRLIYPSSFSDSLRSVKVYGEAYFAVKPEKDRPFEVITGETKVAVTGTEFNIKNRNNHISVVVADGSVKTSTTYNDIVFTLRKGDMITYFGNRRNTSPVRVNLNEYLAWRANKFAFSRTPLSEVIDELQRYYNLNVEYSDNNIKSKTITGIFNADSIDKVLSVINLTLDINIEREGNTLIIK